MVAGVDIYERRHKRRAVWYRILSILSAVTVFCTTYALILPAITMEDPAPGIRMEREYLYEDETMRLLLKVEGRAVFKHTPADPGSAKDDAVQMTVNQLAPSDPVYEQYFDYLSQRIEDEDLRSLSALEFLFFYEGQELDVSGCTLTAEAAPSSLIFEENGVPRPVSDGGTELLRLHGETLSLYLSSSTEGVMNAQNEDEGQTLAFTALQGTVDDLADQDTVWLTEGAAVPTLRTSLSGSIVAFAAYSAANPSFTVQYYTTLSVFDTYTKAQYNALSSAQKQMYLPLIDTSGAKLPTNNGTTSATNDLIYVKLVSAGTTNANGLPEYTLAKHSQLMPLYTEKEFRYFEAPALMYFDKSQSSGNYTVSRVMVLKDGKSPTSIKDSDFDIYPADVTFTNNPASAIAGKRIYVEEGAVIRLVYEPIAHTYNEGATFFDYDITDGYIYTAAAANSSQRKPTSTQKNTTTAYAKTEAFGINSFNAGSKPKLIFGNTNTGVTGRTDKLNGAYINMFNRAAVSKDIYMGCSFGLVTGLNASGLPVFHSGIAAPDLFSTKATTGKTIYNNYSLQFIQQGDTFTLSQVNGAGASASDLHLFSNPQTKHSHIYTNHFWPMDSAPSYGANGHDLKFGDEDYLSYRQYTANGATGTFPPGDDGFDHNSYFGMSYDLEFEVSEDYLGPLEYIFYGDDDMWVFLDGKLVCDIGGVHSSVGEYVNLWDYVEKGKASKHTLRFFYTERGASGSTCYMQFTLPSVSVKSGQNETASFRVEKEVQNSDTTQTFDFTLRFTDAHGNPLINTYTYTVYNADLTVASNGLLENSAVDFALSHGQYIVVDYLPIGAKYTVTESSYPGFFTVHSVSGGANVEAATASGSISAGTTDIRFVNSTSAILPSTGGGGVLVWYLPLGLAILWMLATPLILSRAKQRQSRVTH